MMDGYQADEALAFVIKAIAKDFSGVPANRLEAYVRSALAIDQRYMEQVEASDGGFYDDDDAFEMIVERMIAELGASEEEELLIAQVADAYMEAHEAYLEGKGLIDWDGE